MYASAKGRSFGRINQKHPIDFGDIFVDLIIRPPPHCFVLAKSGTIIPLHEESNPIVYLHSDTYAAGVCCVSSFGFYRDLL
jgi:hypothetical protein